MRIEDLFESPTDTKGIEKAADAITEYIQRNFTGDELNFVGSDVPAMGKHQPRFRNMNIRVVPVSTGSLDGSFNGTFNTLTLYFNGNHGALFTTIVHELRHALDASKSGRNNKFMDRSRPYDSSQHEINARFTEVLVSLNRKLRASLNSGLGMTIDEYMNEFEVEAARHNLLKVFDGANDSQAMEILSSLGKDNKIFGRKIDPENFIRAKQGRSRLVGKVGDRRYRRLINRLITNYEYIKNTVRAK